MEIDNVEPETLRLQLTKAIDIYQSHVTLYIQGLGFLIAADVILIGYGINERKLAPLLVAVLMPALMLLLRIEAGRNAMAAAYVAMYLENRMCPGIDPLVTTLLAARFAGSYRILEEALNEPEGARRMAILQESMSRWNVLKDRDTSLFLLAILAQSGILLISAVIFEVPFM